MKNTDVLVIGSGGAGCSAAIEANNSGCNVLMITLSEFLDSKTANAQGGIQAAISNEDSYEAHINDTLKAGEYENDIELVKILAKNAPDTIAWLEAKGVEFDKKADKYHLQHAAGLSHARILSCGDKSGNRLMNPLKKTIENTNIEVWLTSYPTNITKENNGYFIVDIESKVHGKAKILSKTIILACGGYIAPEKKIGLAKSNNRNIPDLYNILNQIGIEVILPDLLQYHPTGILLPKALRRERVPETVRSAGATILNKHLLEFCDPLELRNKLTNKIVEECKKGNGVQTKDGRIGVWLNTPKVEEIHGVGYYEKHFPTLLSNFSKHGIDIRNEMILVYPILHYSLGGIKIDKNSETNITGLFAAGEATYGVHGKDRLMGNSLLDIFVFGRIAGQNAAKTAQRI